MPGIGIENDGALANNYVVAMHESPDIQYQQGKS